MVFLKSQRRRVSRRSYATRLTADRVFDSRGRHEVALIARIDKDTPADLAARSRQPPDLSPFLGGAEQFDIALDDDARLAEHGFEHLLADVRLEVILANALSGAGAAGELRALC